MRPLDAAFDDCDWNPRPSLQLLCASRLSRHIGTFHWDDLSAEDLFGVYLSLPQLPTV
jgi:hypothetical protein